MENIKGNDNLKDILESSDNLKIVDFYANWCSPCKAISSILDKIDNEYSDNVDIYKVDIEIKENKDLIKNYMVKSIPTLVFFKNGEIVDKKVGSISMAEIEDIISAHI